MNPDDVERQRDGNSRAGKISFEMAMEGATLKDEVEVANGYWKTEDTGYKKSKGRRSAKGKKGRQQAPAAPAESAPVTAPAAPAAAPEAPAAEAPKPAEGGATS